MICCPHAIFWGVMDIVLGICFIFRQIRIIRLNSKGQNIKFAIESPFNRTRHLQKWKTLLSPKRKKKHISRKHEIETRLFHVLSISRHRRRRRRLLGWLVHTLIWRFYRYTRRVAAHPASTTLSFTTLNDFRMIFRRGLGPGLEGMLSCCIYFCFCTQKSWHNLNRTKAHESTKKNSLLQFFCNDFFRNT